MDTNDLITTIEAAWLARVSERTMFRWLKQGKIPRYHHDGRAYVSRTEMESYLHSLGKGAA